MAKVNMLRSVPLAAMFAMAMGVPAQAASTTFTVTSSWTKVASSGDTVVIENRTQPHQVYLATAGSAPSAGTLGIALQTSVVGLSARFSGTLTADLYATCADCGSGQSAQIVVDTGASSGGGGVGGSVTQGTSPWVTSVSSWAGGALGSMANYGTSPGAVLVPGVNAFVTNSVTVAGTVGLGAGTQIVGKAGIDQTTDVTTNGIEVAPTTGSAAGITPVVSTSAEGSHVLKGSAGNLYSVYMTAGAASGFLMVFNTTSAPADGVVTPIHCLPVAANSMRGLTFNSGPVESYSTGITAVFSTTGCFTKTISATAFFHGSVK